MELKGLNTKILGRKIIYYKEIDSTQNEIWRQYEQGAPNGLLIMADVQTKGKGTHGRVWHTDEPNNIAFSFLIRTNCEIQKTENLTIEIANIIVEIFSEKYGINLNIKEPNDIVFKGRKIGGILTQSKVVGKKIKCLVIGIGINTMQEKFAEEIKDIATSIKREFKIEIDRNEFIAKFCNKFESLPLGTDLFGRRESSMKIGFLFPGQGTQKIGMGKDIYEKYEEARKIYNLVRELTGIDIAKISFEGEEAVLNETKYTQSAILTMSLAILEILKKNNIKAEMSAGLSLGEYAALVSGGALSTEDAIRLVQKRGEYMQTLLPEGNWKMAAIFGLNEEQVWSVCGKVKNKFVVPANFNTKEQIVISGEEEGILEAEKIAKELGAKKVRILNTAGPFHTEKLQRSSEALKAELEKVEFKPFNSTVVKNLDGRPYSEEDDIKEILAKHIVNPVRFSKAIETMLDSGIDTFVEIGPGKTLSGFVKKEKEDREVNILNICDVKTLEEAINFLKINSI